jgi:hypothetical protein
MSWLARLKKTSLGAEMEPAKPAKPGFVGFVGPTLLHLQKNEGFSGAANDPSSDPDQWCWPNSPAMNTAEIETFTARLLRFTAKGLPVPDSEALAEKLINRDREQDDRVICLECRHIAGYGAGSWRCANWKAAGIAVSPRHASLSIELVMQLHRCGGFTTYQEGSNND